jgi:phosphoribosylformimino-5-aminoimidazole carboxamide ribotide isomerase
LRTDVIERCRHVADGIPLQVSGGIRSLEAAHSALTAGASRVIVGTAIWSEESALGAFVEALGDQLVVALDVRAGQIAVRGWLHEAPFTFQEALSRCEEQGVTRVHVTAIERDGTMRGPDLSLYEEACRSEVLVVAAGGVRDEADVEALARVGCEAAVMGMGYLARLGL